MISVFQCLGRQNLAIIENIGKSISTEVRNLCLPYLSLGVGMWIFIFVHHWQFPTFPNYITSMIFYDSIFLFGLSEIHQVALSFICWAQILLFLVVNITFARSIIHCLEVLVDPMNYKQLDFGEFQWRINAFFKLQDLMDWFNEVFKWHVFLQMAGAVTYLCLALYVPLRYWKSLGWASILQMAYAAITILFGIMWNYYMLMGKVWEKSSKFKNSIKTQLFNHLWDGNCGADSKTSYKRLKMQISTCCGFGFKGGNFFVFKTATLITVFYSVITHIIILLQLDL